MQKKITNLRKKGKSYNEIAEEVGCSKSLVSYYCGEGQKEKAKIRKAKNKESRGKKPNPKPKKICQNCNKEFKSDHKKSKYCCTSCSAEHRHKKYILNWKSGDERGYTGKTCGISNYIRRYMFEKYDNKCCKCGWGEVHPVTGKIPLEINHIDGDAKRCEEENLELVCPNCHSLTPNFRALNKKSTRRG